MQHLYLEAKTVEQETGCLLNQQNSRAPDCEQIASKELLGSPTINSAGDPQSTNPYLGSLAPTPTSALCPNARASPANAKRHWLRLATLTCSISTPHRVACFKEIAEPKPT